jgi:hypothetical protein
MLGYGIPEASFARGLAMDPHVIAADAGSTDPGPYYLGAGVSFTHRAMVKRDLTLILTAAYDRHVPVIIGSAGGAGARPHLDWFLEIVDEVLRERGLRFPTAVIPSDVDPAWLTRRLAEGAVSELELPRPLSVAEIERASHLVAQMGPEPIMAALDDAQLVVCGRASDPAIMAAPALRDGYDPALAMHMGKILECGAAAAEPRHGTDGLLGTIRADGFLVTPTNPAQRCTVESVAAHMLYERADPTRSHWPGGTLDLTPTRLEQADDRTVRVSGPVYHRDAQYRVKIEGAARCGYRTIAIAGTRDPLLLAGFDHYEQNLRQRVAEVVEPLRDGADYRLQIRVYGRDGVMGPSEPDRRIEGHELGLIFEVIADTEAVSRQVLAVSRSAALHSTYPGRKAIAGNLAFPFSPSDIGAGDVYEFNIYHLVRLADPLELFPIAVGDKGEPLMGLPAGPRTAAGGV